MSFKYEYNGYRCITGYPGAFDKAPAVDSLIQIYINPRFPSEIYITKEESEHSLAMILPSIIIAIVSGVIMMKVW
ncbi:MAG: hypothetical protein VZR27_07400 [Acutalibacteraceae bacterium]|nr:hypothetical protein [Acutalibacteraceae bacterium]